MAQRLGPIAGVVVLGFVIAGAAMWMSDTTYTVEAPEPAEVAPAPTGEPAAPVPDSYAAPLSSGEYTQEQIEQAIVDSERLSGQVAAEGWRGEAHRHAAAALLSAEVEPELRVFAHDKVDTFCERVDGYEDAIAAGEMAQRDLAVNTEEAVQMLERQLAPRLGRDTARAVGAAVLRAR